MSNLQLLSQVFLENYFSSLATRSKAILLKPISLSVPWDIRKHTVYSREHEVLTLGILGSHYWIHIRLCMIVLHVHISFAPYWDRLL